MPYQRRGGRRWPLPSRFLQIELPADGAYQGAALTVWSAVLQQMQLAAELPTTTGSPQTVSVGVPLPMGASRTPIIIIMGATSAANKATLRSQRQQWRSCNGRSVR